MLRVNALGDNGAVASIMNELGSIMDSLRAALGFCSPLRKSVSRFALGFGIDLHLSSSRPTGSESTKVPSTQ